MTINDPRDQPEYQVGGNKYKGAFEKKDPEGTSAQVVNKFHNKSDVDTSQKAQHHTLGTKHDQAASGDHDHDGSNSRKLMTGVSITGAKGGNVALTNLINALETALGFTDNTT